MRRAIHCPLDSVPWQQLRQIPSPKATRGQQLQALPILCPRSDFRGPADTSRRRRASGGAAASAIDDADVVVGGGGGNYARR